MSCIVCPLQNVSDLVYIVNKQIALRKRFADNVVGIAALNVEHMCQAAAPAYEHNVADPVGKYYENSELEKELASLES